MNEFTVTITAKVACRQCNGQGMIYGSHERGCEACGERGYTVERVTLDADALIQLGNAIRTVQSVEYAEATREETPKCSMTGCDAPAVVWKSSSAANASAFCAEHDRQVRAELAEAQASE